MRSWLLAGWALLGSVACGGVVQTTGSSGSGGASSTAVGATTSATSATHGSTTGSVASATSSSATTGTGGAESGVVNAYGYSGGLDHLAIFKADPVRDLCFYVFAEAPTMPSLGITFPPSWGAFNAGVAQGAATCTPSTLGTGAAQVSGASGTVSFSPPVMGCQTCVPTTIDSVAITLDFSPTAPWVPASEPIQATNLAVGAWP